MNIRTKIKNFMANQTPEEADMTQAWDLLEEAAEVIATLENERESLEDERDNYAGLLRQEREA